LFSQHGEPRDALSFGVCREVFPFEIKHTWSLENLVRNAGMHLDAQSKRLVTVDQTLKNGMQNGRVNRSDQIEHG
jgi:hypothetical protein